MIISTQAAIAIFLGLLCLIIGGLLEARFTLVYASKKYSFSFPFIIVGFILMLAGVDSI